MTISKDKYEKLRLFRAKGVGPVIYRKLMERYGSAAAAMEAFPELNKKYKKRLVVASQRLLDTELEAILKMNGHILSYEDENFPTALKFIHDCPPFLTVLGDVNLLGKEQVAIVGNRNASFPAMKFTNQIAGELCKQDYVVTSGLAKGIDSAAHKGALAAEGQTIAVLAGGVDHIYPPENDNLYKDIIEKGAIVSEMPLGTAPTQNHFPRRNRIVSGLSLGTFVVEAAKRSGSLITARLASEQGREVFAMPGSPADARSSGPNYLLQNGATMVQTVDDILDNLPKMVVGHQAHSQQTLDLPENTPHTSNVAADMLLESESSVSAENTSPENSILDLLSATPTPLDDLIRLSGIPEAQILSMLADLELDGVVERQPAGLVRV